MVLKLVPISIEGVIIRLMQERRGSRPSASIEEWRKILEDLVAAERAEAADEIERLRKALEGLVAYLGGQAYRNYEDESELLTAARAALKGKP